MLGDVFYKHSQVTHHMWAIVLHSLPFTTCFAQSLSHTFTHVTHFCVANSGRFTKLSQTCNFTVVVHGLSFMVIVKCVWRLMCGRPQCGLGGVEAEMEEGREKQYRVYKLTLRRYICMYVK